MQRAITLQNASERCRHFRVGRNRSGQWVAVDAAGTCGGIFASREAALDYAAFETDRRPGSISLDAQPIDLEI